MALACLHLKQADGHLPMVCMRCGAPATAVQTKLMTWQPFAGEVKRFRLHAPLCARHQGHWTVRRIVTWGVGLLAVGFLCVALIACFMMNGTPPRPHWVDVVGPLLAVIGVVSFVGCLPLAIVLDWSGIRPREVTCTHVLLTGVCEEFVDAVENAEIERRVRLRQWELQDARDESRAVRADNLIADTQKPAAADAIERRDLDRVPPSDAIQE